VTATGTPAVTSARKTGLGERLKRTYLQIDLRSLAFGRIVFGLVLIGDLLRRVPWLRDFYSNVGLVPNHTVLWRPPFPRIFSFLFMASLPEESAAWSDMFQEGRRMPAQPYGAVDHGHSHVLRGENAGREMDHVAIADSFHKVGKLAAGTSFAKDIQAKLDDNLRSGPVRIIAYVQDNATGRIIGVTQTRE